MGKLDDLRAREATLADTLAERARSLGMAALQPSTLVVARLAVELVQRDDGRGTVSEPAEDLRRLRTDTRLIRALEGDLQRAVSTALGLIIESLRQGYEVDLRGRAEATESEATGLSLLVIITPQDLHDLAAYPVLGHAPREIARHLSDQLRYDVEGALAAPLTGRIDAASTPEAVGDVARKHGDRLAAAVREAFYAGAQAATKALTAAFVGA
ncbi:hypothetical protein [Methylibium sp.]|uniref:hypothetical protein n=1 Tax=Methylibium sp. TaxID=2067992 RepID=UPI0017D929D5|nr:hypothetical protein [Methylibium sp.]MBA3588847.1 hypothetical protein [Methylibium sp.]